MNLTPCAGLLLTASCRRESLFPAPLWGLGLPGLAAGTVCSALHDPSQPHLPQMQHGSQEAAFQGRWKSEHIHFPPWGPTHDIESKGAEAQVLTNEGNGRGNERGQVCSPVDFSVGPALSPLLTLQHPIHLAFIFSATLRTL